MTKPVHVGIVGGGINGLCAAWELRKLGAEVTLFERDEVVAHTSRSSSKLLHGGLRYLENFEFRLVKEALAERHWWLENAPKSMVKPLKILLPIYVQQSRSRLLLKTGLWLYDRLAGGQNIANHQHLSAANMLQECPLLNRQGLKGGYQFWDGQMDDFALGNWVAAQVRDTGATILEQHKVSTLTTCGELVVNQKKCEFDHIINLAGPWAQQLLTNSGIHSSYQLDLVRGSHIVIDQPLASGLLLPVPQERRIFFVLPYQDKTLIGTTEVRQGINAPVTCSDEEKEYLLRAYNSYFTHQIAESDIIDSFAGVRPLIYSDASPNKATREYKFETVGRLTTVFGGKWTTARALGEQVAKDTIKRAQKNSR